MTLLNFLLNLLISVLLGGLIGLERQLNSRSIGMRTSVLVCMGASLFITFSFCIDGSDVSRVASQIITGVGFLGSGIIFKGKINVWGINTAATIWCTAGIGMLVGASLYMYAVVATGVLIIGNIILRPVSNHIEAKNFFNDIGGYLYKVNLSCHQTKESIVRTKIVELMSDKHTCLLGIHSVIENENKLRLEVGVCLHWKRLFCI